MRIFMIVLACLFALTSRSYALEERTLTHNGQERLFLIDVPETVKGNMHIPAVIVMHGGGGSAKGMAVQTRMENVGAQKGFITIYPQGTAARGGRLNTWNAGKCCANAVAENIDDVGFISALIVLVTKEYNVDPKRVYATGHSNGAMMSYRLACELSDKIAAIAPNAGQDMRREGCEFKRFVPVLHIHGKEDICAPYFGGKECGGCFQDVASDFGLRMNKRIGGVCYPVEDMVEQWAVFNGCSMHKSLSFKKGSVVCQTYEHCNDNAPVTLCSIENAGHSWPGGQGNSLCQKRPNSKICAKMTEKTGKTNTDINAGEFMWEFFARHKID